MTVTSTPEIDDEVTAPGPAATRAAILAGAEEEFGARGYRATTIEAVARAAGVSRPLVYRYFGDKEELYRQAVADVLARWNDALAEAAGRAAPTWAHRFRLVVRTCVGWAAEHRMLRGVLLQDSELARRIAGSTLAAGRDLLPALLADLLRAGAADGAVRADLDADDMAWVIAEVAIAGSTQALRATAPELRDSRLDAMVETLLHGVLLATER